MLVISSVLFFAASTLAFTVTGPANGTTWSQGTQGQTISWTSVSTDRQNFSIVLSNQQVNPSYSQVISTSVDTSAGTTTVTPPSSGWPTGKGFQINLIQDAQNLNSILAQSGQFDIVAGGTPSQSQSVLVASNKPSSTSSTNTPGSSDSPDLSQHGDATSLGVSNFYGLAGIALLGALFA